MLVCCVIWVILFLGINYIIIILIGDIDGVDIDVKVYIILYGEKGDLGFRKLDIKYFMRGK